MARSAIPAVSGVNSAYDTLSATPCLPSARCGTTAAPSCLPVSPRRYLLQLRVVNRSDAMATGAREGRRSAGERHCGQRHYSGQWQGASGRCERLHMLPREVLLPHPLRRERPCTGSRRPLGRNASHVVRPQAEFTLWTVPCTCLSHS